ncbi:MAG: hypothetical protein VX185_01280 [Pseudomonadota bacterium]|nr:hypothetical protein [Pseudomonadota bacterium]
MVQQLSGQHNAASAVYASASPLVVASANVIQKGAEQTGYLFAVTNTSNPTALLHSHVAKVDMSFPHEKTQVNLSFMQPAEALPGPKLQEIKNNIVDRFDSEVPAETQPESYKAILTCVKDQPFSIMGTSMGDARALKTALSQMAQQVRQQLTGEADAKPVEVNVVTRSLKVNGEELHADTVNGGGLLQPPAAGTQVAPDMTTQFLDGKQV